MLLRRICFTTFEMWSLYDNVWALPIATEGSNTLPDRHHIQVKPAHSPKAHI